MKLQIQEQDPIEVFVTVSGHICIQQTRIMESEPCTVLVANGNAKKLARLLNSLIADAKTAESEHCQEESRPDA